MSSAELIRRVWQHPAIWDRTDRTYRNKALKEMLWQKVANELGCSVKVCQVKWKSLRDRYAKEVKKEQQDPTIFTIEKKWLYFDRLHFLKDTLCPRAVLPKLSAEEIQAQRLPKLERDPTDDYIEELPTVTEMEDFDETLDRLFADKSENEDQQQARSNSPTSSLTDLPPGFGSFFEELAMVIKQRKDDECEIFGKLVAAKMRRIPENRRTYVENMILKCLNDEIETNNLIECDEGSSYRE